MILQLGCYQIRPNNPGLALYKHIPGGTIITRGMYKGKEVAEGWKPMNKFPHNLAHALHLIAEDYVTSGGKKQDFAPALREVTRYMNAISAAAKELPNESASD